MHSDFVEGPILPILRPDDDKKPILPFLQLHILDFVRVVLKVDLGLKHFLDAHLNPLLAAPLVLDAENAAVAHPAEAQLHFRVLQLHVDGFMDFPVLVPDHYALRLLELFLVTGVGVDLLLRVDHHIALFFRLRPVEYVDNVLAFWHGEHRPFLSMHCDHLVTYFLALGRQ